MGEGQLWALVAFAGVLLLLSVLMWPTSRRMNGAQKYRANRREGGDVDPSHNRNTRRDDNSSPLAILGAIFAANAASDSQSNDGHDAGDSSGDAGGDGGGGGAK
jgi:hypothetical protein